MKRIRIYEFQHLLTSIIIWILALQVFLFIRFGGYSATIVNHIAPRLLSEFNHNIFLAFFTGGLMGLIFGTLEFYVFRTKWKHLSFGKLLIIRLFTYVISLLFTTVFIAFVYSLLIKNLSLAGTIKELGKFIKDAHFKLIGVYGLLVSITLFFFGQMNKKIGEGALIHIISGRYHRPKEEYRIFMFIDLENSTYLASHLGHIKFSRMLQEAYTAMSKYIIQYRAKVYQHVGDEVVITWKKSVEENDILKFFFAYKQELLRQHKKYRQNYGVMPRFRASLNAGVVTVAEVGVTKRETVFHGDVLNVAARIQKLCKKYDADILTTESLIKTICESKHFQIEKLNKVMLEGKKQPTQIYKIHQINHKNYDYG